MNWQKIQRSLKAIVKVISHFEILEQLQYNMPTSIFKAYYEIF